MSRKYLELFTQGFDSTVEEKRKLENKPYILNKLRILEDETFTKN